MGAAMTPPQTIAGQVLLTGLAVGCFASFSWAIACFFVRDDKLPNGMRLIQGFGLTFMIAHLAALAVAFRSSLPAIAVAVVLYLFALSLFWWSIATIRARPFSIAFSPDSPQHLVTSGPYRWIRHPLYASYLIAWFAGCVATTFIGLAVTPLVMAVLYWYAARQEEQKFVGSSFAGEYQAYRARTGLFWPNPLAPGGFVRGV